MPDRRCFRFIETDGTERDFTYRELRMKAVTLAMLLQRRGIRRDSCVLVDLQNCPEFVILAAAAAYGGFSLAVLNNRLTSAEKLERRLDLEHAIGPSLLLQLDEEAAAALISQARTREDDWLFEQEGVSKRKGLFRQKEVRQSTRSKVPTVSEAIHFAEKALATFDPERQALVMFTSGTSGRPKAASLSWENLCEAAESSNAVLGAGRGVLWQAALPLYHIGGFEVVVRSILGFNPFVLYRRFDPGRILGDAAALGATHLSVVDKMLRDLLDVDRSQTLERYQAVLLGGAAPNEHNLKRATKAKIRLFASYGMTETSSQIASALVTQSFDGGLGLLPGYEAQIIDPDGAGVGQLAVRGPGVLTRYLNARAAFTADGFFLTGDRASIARGRIFVQERAGDVFVSGGENIYPAEISEKLGRIPGVRDTYIFGVDDEEWGKRPVAFIEYPSPEGRSPQSQAEEIRRSAETRLSKLYLPRHFYVLENFPRISIGKVDRAALHALYDERLEVKQVRLYHIRQRFKAPVKTAKTLMAERESLILEVTDHAGRTGLGEGVAFPTSWYLPETLLEDRTALEQHLIPKVLSQVYLHPREVTKAFDECMAGLPMAKAALETALWDLYGKVVGKPLWQLLGEEVGGQVTPGEAKVSAGAVVGLMPVDQAVEAVRRAVDAGYMRVKLKIAPGSDVAHVSAIRTAFPDLMLMLDANQAYTESDIEVLKTLDGLGIACIEEPLDPGRVPRVGPTGLFPRLARLQRQLQTPVCLDESLASVGDVENALARPELNCFSLKVAKWGGIAPALDFYRRAHARGSIVWMGGMFDTSVSKRMHAAFQTLPGIVLPGDICPATAYFEADITRPSLSVVHGKVLLNDEGHVSGLGCELDEEALRRVVIEERVFPR